MIVLNLQTSAENSDASEDSSSDDDDDDEPAVPKLKKVSCCCIKILNSTQLFLSVLFLFQIEIY